MHITQSVDPTTLRPLIIHHRCTASRTSVTAVELRATLTTATHRHTVIAVVTPGMDMAFEDIEEFQ